MTDLCRDHPVSVLCVYDRDGDRDGAGIEHVDLAVARHPDGLQEQRLALRRIAHTLYVVGEIEMSNLDVFAIALRALTNTPSSTVHIDMEGVTGVTHPQDSEGTSDAHVYAGNFAIHKRQFSMISGL